jgi:hypothetical protein
MKMNFWGATAVALAIVASAIISRVNATNKKTSGLYWFSIVLVDIPPSGAVPMNDASFIQQSVFPPGATCPSGMDFQCISGFSAGQVNTTTHQLRGTQIPQTIAQTRD